MILDRAGRQRFRYEQQDLDRNGKGKGETKTKTRGGKGYWDDRRWARRNDSWRPCPYASNYQTPSWPSWHGSSWSAESFPHLGAQTPTRAALAMDAITSTDVMSRLTMYFWMSVGMPACSIAYWKDACTTAIACDFTQNSAERKHCWGSTLQKRILQAKRWQDVKQIKISGATTTELGPTNTHWFLSTP